ncbi:MAG: acyl--CoA ligase, partial [Clostridia bacterium]|nr:acyl--CoA ligase [Clostridia bacterium]
MPITEYLERNAREFKDEVALVEINPEMQEAKHVTWREYALIETNPSDPGRKELTWGEFDKKANRFANLLLSRGVRKGDRVAILLMNSIEWLPVYFGILKSGALAVPLNYRYTAEEIKYCLDLSDS